MAATDTASELLSTVKSYLRITWQDDPTDALITGYIARGQQRLNSIAGATLDYTAEGLPRALLLDYCRYANSQALEVFEHNFEADLLELYMQSQAPIVDALTVLEADGSTSGAVKLRVIPTPYSDSRYVIQIGSGTLPARADVCAGAPWAEWDGSSPLSATSGQQVMVAEVDQNYRAVRAGMVTVT